MRNNLNPELKQAIAAKITEGKGNATIARELNIKSQTVANYKNYYFTQKGKHIPNAKPVKTDSPAHKAAKTRRLRKMKVLSAKIPPIICGNGNVRIEIAEGFESHVLVAPDGVHITF